MRGPASAAAYPSSLREVLSLRLGGWRPGEDKFCHAESLSEAYLGQDTARAPAIKNFLGLLAQRAAAKGDFAPPAVSSCAYAIEVYVL